MRSMLLAAASLASILSLCAPVAGHDPGDVPPKVTNLVAPLRLVAVEITKEHYILLLENTSDRPLRRLEWAMAHEEELRRGAFSAAASGLVSPRTLFDARVPRPPAAEDDHDEEHLSEEDAEAHRPRIVLEVALFAGGTAQGDPRRVSLAAAQDEGARFALPPVLDALKQIADRGEGVRPALRAAVEHLRALEVPPLGIPSRADPGLSEAAWRAAASESFRTEVEAFAASLDGLEHVADEDLLSELHKIISNGERAQSERRQ